MSAATDDLIAACSSLAEAVRAAAADPADAVRLLTGLAAFDGTATPHNAGAAALASATAALVRRSALGSLALACATVAFASSQEANALRDQVATLMDTEAVAAADAGQDDTYIALSDLRAAVIADLTARSAQLPDLITVQSRVPMPSLVFAYQLYGDTTREPQLVARAGVADPGVMPIVFEALAA